MVTAASDIPLEFGADPAKGGRFGWSWRRERGYSADVFKEKFMQNHFESVHHSRGGISAGGRSS